MKTAFNFVALLMSLLIVQATSLSQTQKETPTAKGITPAVEPASDDNNEKENQEANLIINSNNETEDESILPPFLTCTISHGDDACNAMCSMIGSIYGHVVDSGTCQNRYFCDCPMSSKATLDDLWNAKFNAESVLDEIRNDDQLSREVMKILQVPLQTRETTLEHLKSILTAEQLRKIEVKDNIAKVLRVDGKPSKTALGKYVAKELANSGLHDRVYISRLDDFFHYGEKQSFPRLIREIRRSDIKLLNAFLNGVIGLYRIPEPPKNSYTEETFIEMLDTAIIDECMSSWESPDNDDKPKTKKP